MKRLLLISIVALGVVSAALIPNTANAQSKSETRQYKSTLKKGTIKAYDKFLKKYKQSVYFSSILYKRDSTIFEGLDHNDVICLTQFAEQYPNSPIIDEVEELITILNTSSLSVEEATSIFSSFFHSAAEDKTLQITAIGRRHLNVDYIIGVALGESTVAASHFRIYSLRESDGEWKVDSVADFSKHSFGEEMVSSEFTDTICYLPIADRKFIAFSYLNHDSTGRKIEYVTNLLDMESWNVIAAGFNGNNVLLAKGTEKETINKEYLIEGQSPDILSNGMMIPEAAYLLEKIKVNPGLMLISKANALTDESVDWWYTKNPKAEKSARTLSFGILSKESSLVEQYIAQKSKEKSRIYNAALFNIRGNSVICAFDKRTKEYILVWCEPQCVNKNRDKLLNSIYFEGDNVLNLFYYQGKQTFKIRINLANKSVKR